MLDEVKKKVYPSHRYHPKLGNVIVKDEEHEASAAPTNGGWVTTPADFPPPAPADPTVCSACGQKLPVAAPAKPAKPAKDK